MKTLGKPLLIASAHQVADDVNRENYRRDAISLLHLVRK